MVPYPLPLPVFIPCLPTPLVSVLPPPILRGQKGADERRDVNLLMAVITGLEVDFYGAGEWPKDRFGDLRGPGSREERIKCLVVYAVLSSLPVARIFERIGGSSCLEEAKVDLYVIRVSQFGTRGNKPR